MSHKQDHGGQGRKHNQPRDDHSQTTFSTCRFIMFGNLMISRHEQGRQMLRRTGPPSIARSAMGVPRSMARGRIGGPEGRATDQADNDYRKSPFQNVKIGVTQSFAKSRPNLTNVSVKISSPHSSIYLSECEHEPPCYFPWMCRTQEVWRNDQTSPVQADSAIQNQADVLCPRIAQRGICVTERSKAR